MKCSKCNGFMFVERYYDYFLRFDAWKCINCGNIMDSTINENRQNYQAKLALLEEAEPILAKVE